MLTQALPGAPLGFFPGMSRPLNGVCVFLILSLVSIPEEKWSRSEMLHRTSGRSDGNVEGEQFGHARHERERS